MKLDSINSILEQFSVEAAFTFEEMPKTTSGNTSYRVFTPQNKYVVRQLVRQSAPSAIEERGIQEVLREAGIHAPLYLKTASGDVVISDSENRYFVVSSLVPGVRQSEDTLRLARDMGKTLAIIHNVMGDTHISFNRQQWFNPSNTAYQLQLYNGPEKEFVFKHTQLYSSILDKGLPLAMTHGDFHTNNIYSADDKVTAVFDFESAEHTVRILDIARLYLTYVKVTHLGPQEILESIIEGYNVTANLQLTESEYGELDNACIYVALVSSVSIANHGNYPSSKKYIEIATCLISKHTRQDVG